MTQFVVTHPEVGTSDPIDSRSEAEERAEQFAGASVEVYEGDETIEEPDVVEDTEPVNKPDTTEAKPPETDHHGKPVEHPQGPPKRTTGEMETKPVEQTYDEDALDRLGESIDEDPLDILPGYMITHVDGKPSLNKRGVSVLAYHYDIDVLEREVVAYPHENDFTTAVVEIMVKGGDGRQFAGIGEAHVDETPKHQLLRMAETRAYKRAVIFATGTGIVGYQEISDQLE